MPAYEARNSSVRCRTFLLDRTLCEKPFLFAFDSGRIRVVCLILAGRVDTLESSGFLSRQVL
jgi:hypothetical protein